MEESVLWLYWWTLGIIITRIFDASALGVLVGQQNILLAFGIRVIAVSAIGRKFCYAPISWNLSVWLVIAVAKGSEETIAQHPVNLSCTTTDCFRKQTVTSNAYLASIWERLLHSYTRLLVSTPAVWLLRPYSSWLIVCLCIVVVVAPFRILWKRLRHLNWWAEQEWRRKSHQIQNCNGQNDCPSVMGLLRYVHPKPSWNRGCVCVPTYMANNT